MIVSKFLKERTWGTLKVIFLWVMLFVVTIIYNDLGSSISSLTVAILIDALALFVIILSYSIKWSEGKIQFSFTQAASNIITVLLSFLCMKYLLAPFGLDPVNIFETLVFVAIIGYFQQKLDGCTEHSFMRRSLYYSSCFSIAVLFLTSLSYRAYTLEGIASNDLFISVGKIVVTSSSEWLLEHG